MTREQANSVVTAVAAAHKKARFGKPMRQPSSGHMVVSVYAAVKPETILTWFVKQGVQVIKLDTTGGLCLVTFKEQYRKERT